MGEESSKRSYKNGRIYCIRNYVDNDLYVGCSTQPLSKRMEKHRSSMKNDRDKNTRLYTKMNELGVENFYIELVEEYPCKNIEQLRAREGEWIRKIGTLNKRIEDRTLQEWKEDNAEKMREYHKQYREEHGETLREHHRQYWNEKRMALMKDAVKIIAIIKRYLKNSEKNTEKGGVKKLNANAVLVFVGQI